MKTSIIFVLVVTFAMAAMASIIQQANDIKIVNDDNQVKFSAISGTNQTNPWLEFGSQTNTAFILPANGIILEINGGTGTNSLAAFANTLGLVGTATNGIVPITNGGTGTNSALAARGTLGINEIATNTATTMKVALGLNGGMTTNVNVIFTATGVTNQLRFSNGVLTNVIPQ